MLFCGKTINIKGAGIMAKATKKHKHYINAKPLNIDACMFNKPNRSCLITIKEANSEYLLLEYTGSRLIVGLLGGGALLFLLSCGLPPFEERYVNFLILFILLFITAWGFIDPPTDFKFNRKRGVVTYRNFIGLKRNKPFNKVYLEFDLADRFGHLHQLRLHAGALQHKTICEFDNRNIEEDIFAHQLGSLIIWFMDKNRPLPPGNAFDAYRIEDYICRWRKGFPKPLYPTDPTLANFDKGEYEYNYIPNINDFANEEEYLKYMKFYEGKQKSAKKLKK